MINGRKKIWVLIIVILLAVTLSLPPVWSRVSYRYHEVYRTVKYWINPPSEVVFVPSVVEDGTASILNSVTQAADTPDPQSPTELSTQPAQSTSEAAFTPTSTQPPTPTYTPQPTLTPLPTYALLKGILCERQLMNNCGPATLSMYLSYYDWGKNQLTTGAALKPNAKDVNVMPYELADFVNEHTEQRAIWRYGGDLHTIKALVNAGFPVMIEKGFEPYSLRSDGWMGHYNLVVGYDDEIEYFTAHDSYLMSYAPWGGQIPQELWDTFIGFDFSYSELEQAWRSFNYVFVVVYPPEKEDEVLNLIGPLATDEGACNIAYDRAMQETSSLTDVREQFFAWFNAGTSLVCLQDYANAAKAYDTAFGIYPDIAVDSRPYRILWYETGPYSAYYYTKRFQDVISLANKTLGAMAEPVLEESYYWRALSYHALGDTTRAVADLRRSLEYHPGFALSTAKLKELGMIP